MLPTQQNKHQGQQQEQKQHQPQQQQPNNNNFKTIGLRSHSLQCLDRTFSSEKSLSLFTLVKKF